MTTSGAGGLADIVESGVYRHAIGRLAKGVAVVTTRASGHDHALTADSVTSVSLDPVLLLVCIETDARFHDAVTEAGAFAVNVLSAEQRALATWFSTPGRPLPGQLDRAPHTRSERGIGLLEGTLAALECSVADIHPAGDHSIVVAEVDSVRLAGTPGDALVHFRGQYSALP